MSEARPRPSGLYSQPRKRPASQTATPLDRAEDGERGRPRQTLAGRGLIHADSLAEVGAGAVSAAAQILLAGEQEKGVEPVAGTRIAFDQDAGGAPGRDDIVGHDGLL